MVLASPRLTLPLVGATWHSAAVTIDKRLFAVSSDPALHAELTTPDAIVAAAVREGSIARVRAHIRLHWYDGTVAMAWLRECQSEKFSAASISALPPEQQNARVVELWASFGRFWKALNVCPYGWARWRRLCERAWGYPSYSSGDGWKGRLNAPLYNGQYGGFWRQAAHAAVYTPAAPRGAYSPAYDRAVSTKFWTGNGNPEFGPTDVVFGDPSVYAIENAGARPDGQSALPNRAWAPTVEMHRVWMQRNGSIHGGYEKGLDGPTAASIRLSGSLTLAESWRTYNWSTPHTPNTGNYLDWNIGFALPDAGSAEAFFHFDYSRSVSTDVQWTTVPLRWYWSMLRDPVGSALGALASGPDDREINPASTPDRPMSVLDYLASKTPEDIIREVLFDVVIRNQKMADNTTAFGDLTALSSAAERDEIQRQQTAAQDLAGINRIIDIGGVALGGIVSIAGAGPAGLAIGGGLAQAAKLANNLASNVGTPEQRRTDVFGRLFPPLETLAIVESEDSFRTDMQAMPSLGGAASVVGIGFLTPGVFAALTTGTLRIAEMPHGGVVEVGQTRETPACRWADDTMTVWSCSVPLGGSMWVRVSDATGTARLARTGVDATSPTEIAWPRMLREHRYAIAGLPQGTAVFVDGAPAMGTWTDASMGVWEVFMPQGPHDVRLVAPGAAPVLVTVRAEGDASRATWGALQTASVQQRQTAARGSSAGMWVAGVVGVGALAIFLATVVMDGKPAPKRNPRRK